MEKVATASHDGKLLVAEEIVEGTPVKVFRDQGCTAVVVKEVCSCS